VASAARYKGYRYPIEIIGHAGWLYHRFALSLRDVEELMLARGVMVTYETIRSWCAKFGCDYANQLRRRRPRPAPPRRQMGVVNLFGVRRFSGAAEWFRCRWSGCWGLFGDLIPHLESDSHFCSVVGGGHLMPG
jgi:hypothetical protein